MTSLISTIPRLSGPSVYPFWAISVQSCLAMITMPGFPYNAKDMLFSSTIPSITDQDERARRSSLDSQALGIMNSSLAHNILMHGKENAESLWNYLRDKYVSQLCYGPVVTYCMVYHYTKRTMLARLLANEGPAIYVVHLNRYFVIPPWYYLVVTFCNNIALLGLLLYLQTISALDISRSLGIATLLPRLQNSILFILGWRETNAMSPLSFMQWHFYLLSLNPGIT